MSFNCLSTTGLPKLVCPFTSASIHLALQHDWLILGSILPENVESEMMLPKSNLLYQGFIWRFHVGFRGAVSKSVKHQTSAQMDGYLAEVFQSKIAQIRRAHTQASTMPRHPKNIRSVASRHAAAGNVVVNALLKTFQKYKMSLNDNGILNQSAQWQNTSVKGLKQLDLW